MAGLGQFLEYGVAIFAIAALIGYIKMSMKRQESKDDKHAEERAATERRYAEERRTIEDKHAGEREAARQDSIGWRQEAQGFSTQMMEMQEKSTKVVEQNTSTVDALRRLVEMKGSGN